MKVKDIAFEISSAIDALHNADDKVVFGNIFATNYDDVVLSILALHDIDMETNFDNRHKYAHRLPPHPVLDEFIRQYGSARATLWAFCLYRSSLLGIDLNNPIWMPPCTTFYDRMRDGLNVPDAQELCEVRSQCTRACCGRGSGPRNDWNSGVDSNLNAAATDPFDSDFAMSECSEETAQLQETTKSKERSPSRATSAISPPASTLSSPLSSPPSTVVPLDDSSDDDSDDSSVGYGESLSAKKRRMRQSSAAPRPTKRRRATRATTKLNPAESSTRKNPPTNRKKSNAIAGPSTVRKRKPKYGRMVRNGAPRKVWPCMKKGCGVVCVNKGDLKRHHESKFHKNPSHQCQKCGFKFTRVDALKRHEKAKKCKATDWKEQERIAKEKADKEKAKKKAKDKAKGKAKEEEDDDDEDEEPESEDEEEPELEVKEEAMEMEGPPSEGESEIDDEEYDDYESEDDDDDAEDEAPISVKLSTAVWD